MMWEWGLPVVPPDAFSKPSLPQVNDSKLVIDGLQMEKVLSTSLASSKEPLTMEGSLQPFPG